jgi:hypothetical protein
MKSLVSLIGAVLMVVAIGWASAGSTAQAFVSRIFMNQTCSTVYPGRATVTFSWTDNHPLALQQWLDLSLQNNGWRPGTFSGAGPLHASVQSFAWDGLMPNTYYYVRHNQVFSTGVWDPSATTWLLTPNCAGTPSQAAAPAPAQQPASTSTQTPASATSPQQNCHPSYPDFCLPPPPPDRDCGQVGGRTNFTVLPPDPHQLDEDRNGIGCERR